MLFLFDENMPRGLAQGLHLIESSNHRSPLKVAVQHAIDFTGRKGATDEEIIEAASGQQAVIFTKDKDFRHIKHYHALYRRHQVSVIFFQASKSVVTYWDMVKAIIDRWEELKQKLAEAAPPVALKVGLHTGVQRMEF